jgi:hypothetical protein
VIGTAPCAALDRTPARPPRGPGLPARRNERRRRARPSLWRMTHVDTTGRRTICCR